MKLFRQVIFWCHLPMGLMIGLRSQTAKALIALSLTTLLSIAIFAQRAPDAATGRMMPPPRILDIGILLLALESRTQPPRMQK